MQMTRVCQGGELTPRAYLYADDKGLPGRGINSKGIFI